MPLPSGSLRNFSFQPEPVTTFSMHAPRPIVPMRSQLAVSELGGTRCLSRSSAGSIPSCSAILSRWTSSAKRGCGVPCPRFGPHGGLLVNALAPWNLRSEEHTSELQSRLHLVCRLLLEKKKKIGELSDKLLHHS